MVDPGKQQSREKISEIDRLRDIITSTEHARIELLLDHERKIAEHYNILNTLLVDSGSSKKIIEDITVENEQFKLANESLKNKITILENDILA